MDTPCESSSASIPTISIIIPCYNESPKRIECTLRSVLEQDYPSKELIVVDGGSGAETIAALRRYSANFTLFVSESDAGIYDAMNKGLARSTGAWISIMNVGDCYHTSDVLSQMVRAVTDTNALLVYGNAALYVDEKLLWIERVPYPPSRRFLYYGMICHQAMLVARRAYEQFGTFDTSYRVLADKEWLLRSMALGLNSLHCGVTVCDWRVGGASSDPEVLWADKQKLRRAYYRGYEVVSFEVYWALRRIARRAQRTLMKVKCPTCMEAY
jgi:glycosyltransferase involved in cell wall biosynthesis